MLGLGTYAFFWQHSNRSPAPLDLAAMLRRTHALGGEVFQICDYLPVLACSDSQLGDLKALAGDLGITLELGTKGISGEVLGPYLGLARSLGVKLVRGMVNTPEHRPSLSEAQRLLEQALPAYESEGVTIALETYEQMSSRDLVSLVEAVGSENLGICLDPANCVAALENPIDVIDRCAPYVKNMHVKDFAFTRRGGWVGFTLEGTQLGSGLLAYDYMIKAVDPDTRGINRIIEHWLTWQETYEKTAEVENLWNRENLAFMKNRAL